MLREVGLHLDTANSSAILNGHLHVALISPGGAPRVLHEPVLLATLSAVADEEDSVVKLSTACGVVKDATAVGLEARFVGLNSDRDGLLVEGRLQSGDVVTGDIHVSIRLGCSRA